MVNYEIGKIGKVRRGSEEGMYILVKDDLDRTGGYFIFYCRNSSFQGGLGEGFDDWVENPENLEGYFRTPGFEVEWF